MSGVSGGQQPNEEWAKIEYQQAQNSAQHHDSLVWQTASIIWGANLVMLGLLASRISIPTFFLGGDSSRPLVMGVGALGILMSLFLVFMQAEFRYIKTQKYSRCWEIEEAYHLRQHIEAKPLFKWGIQTIIFWIVTGSFVAAWGWVIWETV